MSKRIAVVVFVVAVFLALSSALSVQAQSPTTNNTVEIVGVIQSVQGNLITVNHVQIDITKAHLNVKPGVGVTIKVEGTLDASGNVTATEVATWHMPKANDQAEIVGQIESVNGTQITVGGQMIDLSKAEIHTTLMVGQTVKLHVTFGAGGQVIATEIEVEDASAGTAATVEPTEHATPENPEAATAEPTEHATPENPEATAEATHEAHDAVEAAATEDGNRGRDNAEELTGTIQQVGNGMVVIAGQQIDISNAEIKGNLVVGTVVKVHLTLVNGQLVAREVENGHLSQGSTANVSGQGGHDDSSGDKSGKNNAGANANATSQSNSGNTNGGHNDSSGSGGSGSGDGGHGGNSGSSDGGHGGSSGSGNGGNSGGSGSGKH